MSRGHPVQQLVVNIQRRLLAQLGRKWGAVTDGDDLIVVAMDQRGGASIVETGVALPIRMNAIRPPVWLLMRQLQTYSLFLFASRHFRRFPIRLCNYLIGKRDMIACPVEASPRYVAGCKCVLVNCATCGF